MNEVLLSISVLFNVALIIILAYLYLKELGINFIFQKTLDKKVKNRLTELNPPHVFDFYNKQQKAIVMLGDSITSGVNWAEFVNKNIIGRGIAGETTKQISDRLYQVTELKPKQVFILAGINDFSRLITEKHANIAEKRVINNYRRILDSMIKDSPDTEIFIQSILPVNRDIKYFFYKNINNKIIETNNRLKELADEYNATFINLFDHFYDGENMIPKYTRDGIHLTSFGYFKWREIVTPYFEIEKDLKNTSSQLERVW